MIALLGEAEAGRRHRTFRPGSIHSFVALVSCAEVERAVGLVTQELLADGFVSLTVEEAGEVPRWRAILPTFQGSRIREAILRRTSIWVYEDDNRAAKTDA